MRRSGFAVLALTALILPLSATAATITVRPGETLTDIAYRSGVSVGTLMRLNNMSNANYLEAGSQLQVPGPRVNAGSGRHRVKKGETLSRIATQYKVSSRDLMIVKIHSWAKNSSDRFCPCFAWASSARLFRQFDTKANPWLFTYLEEAKPNNRRC